MDTDTTQEVQKLNPNVISILWVQDGLDGPISGVANYYGRKLWFQRKPETAPPLVSDRDREVRILEQLEREGKEDDFDRLLESLGDDYEEERANILPSPALYDLLELEPGLLQQLETNHAAYCAHTNLPYYHGDVLYARNTRAVQKADFSNLPHEDGAVLGGALRSLLNTLKYEHTVDVNNVAGTLVTTIPGNVFSNYIVVHPVLRR